MGDLFDIFNMQEYSCYKNLPPELFGVDLMPDKLKKITVATRSNKKEFVKIIMEEGTVHLLEEITGIKFVEKDKVTYYFKNIINPHNQEESDRFITYNDINQFYMIIIFDKEEIKDVVKTFNLPKYRRGCVFRLHELLTLTLF